jgi:hypothetical protein
MILWGGWPINYPVNSGGRYEPVKDRWLPTSVGANVPIPRREHTAVWTGTEMIVWGGYYGNGWSYLNTGGRYDASTDSWTATSIGANVPNERSAHGAVWSGREMIVWGGRGATQYYQDGGRYKPSSDTWAPTSSESAPTPRSAPSAVWTGAEMIVWGGQPLTSSGGRYCARDSCVASDGPVDCDDHNACTDDACNPDLGCTHLNNDNTCDDGEACTLNDACRNGACDGQSGCDDGLPCTEDLADAANGCACTHAISPAGTSCEDDNPCTFGSVCDGLGGTVAHCGGGSAVSCGDNSICTSDSCDPAIGCVHVASNVCDDGDPCTDDACEASSGCSYTDNEGAPCGGDVCTLGSYCSGGDCHISSVIRDCGDGNVCTDDGCDPVTGCFHIANEEPCFDGDLCTTFDVCGGGSCHAGPLVVCNDSNPCTTDTCFSGTGCVSSPNTNPCDDGNACTTGDVCAAGACDGTPVGSAAEITNVRAQSDKQTYTWDQQPGPSRYDVVRGLLTGLPVGPGGADEACFNDLVTAALVDGTNPAVGDGFWYLSRSQAAGCSGTFGTRGNRGAHGAQRATTTCP